MTGADTGNKMDVQPDWVKDVYQSSRVIDGLGPIFWYQADFGSYLKKVLASGITAFNHTMAVPYDLGPDGILRPDGMSELRGKIDEWERAAEEHADSLLIVREASDIDRAKAEHKVGVIFGLQTLGLIDDDLDRLRVLHEWGIRISGLTYQQRNRLGTGAGAPQDTGLTEFGREAVRAMNELGILVCVSHAGERTGLDAIEASSKPVVFSHVNARRLADNPRNASDDQILAIGRNGGVLGVAAWSSIVSTKPYPTADDFFEHIRYFVERIGIEHVGIGLDLAEGISREHLHNLQKNMPEVTQTPWEAMYPPGLDTAAAWPNVAPGLAQLGYGAAEIRGVLGENFLRVFRDAWA